MHDFIHNHLSWFVVALGFFCLINFILMRYLLEEIKAQKDWTKFFIRVVKVHNQSWLDYYEQKMEENKNV